MAIVVDRRDRVLLGAFVAAAGTAEAIGEAVLAVKTRTPLDVLADTIHPFPTTVRVLPDHRPGPSRPPSGSFPTTVLVMGGLFAQAARRSK